MSALHVYIAKYQPISIDRKTAVKGRRSVFRYGPRGQGAILLLDVYSLQKARCDIGVLTRMCEQ
jgi:hypothetical protein